MTTELTPREACDEINRLNRRLKEAEARADRLRAALEAVEGALKFYANPNHWDETDDAVILAGEPLGTEGRIFIVFNGQDERWPGHPHSAAQEALDDCQRQLALKETENADNG